jgi:hypothetical protein
MGGGGNGGANPFGNFVADIPAIEVWEDKDIRFPGDRGLWSFPRSDLRDKSRIELQLAVDRQAGSKLSDPRGCRAYFFDSGMLGTPQRREREHRHSR